MYLGQLPLKSVKDTDNTLTGLLCQETSSSQVEDRAQLWSGVSGSCHTVFCGLNRQASMGPTALQDQSCTQQRQGMEQLQLQSTSSWDLCHLNGYIMYLDRGSEMEPLPWG